MVRIIKFRSKRIDNREWVHGDFVQIEDDKFIYDYDICDNGVSDIPQLSQIKWNVIPETVGQFTGLKDKDGREIYEGDYLFDGVQTWLVEHSLTTCGFHARDIHAKSIFSLYHLCNKHNCEREVKVIGNIFDNPKLLDFERN